MFTSLSKETKEFFAVLLFACVIGLILFITTTNLSYVTGHDIYFHLDAARAILERNLSLPITIPHYWGDFLFGYPPLYHFVMALVSSVISIPLKTLFIVTPIICVPLLILGAFWTFREFDKKIMLLATSVYCLLGFDLLWPFFSGEYPRYFSGIFGIWGMLLLYKATKNKSILLIALAGLLGGLSMMSNMIGVIFIIPLFGYIAVKALAEQKTFVYSIAGFIAVIVAALWWLRVSLFFGWTYLVNVLTLHQKSTFTTSVTIGLLLLMGYWTFKHKRLPSLMAPWLILGISTGGYPFAYIPLAYYISTYLYAWIKTPRKQAVLTYSFLFAGIVLYYTMTAGKLLVNNNYITPDVVQAASWIENNTPQSETIIAYGQIGQTDANMVNKSIGLITGMFRDESLPYLAGRNTITWFGYEWNVDHDRLPLYWSLHHSLCKNYFVTATKKYQIYPNLVWINKDSLDIKDATYFCNDLASPGFEKIYENESVLLYRVDWEKV